MVDTHAHIYDESFAADISDVIARAQLVGVKKIFMPNIDARSMEPMLAMEAQYKGICRPMMGIHPCYVDREYKKELAVAESWLARREFWAIGEIGIDLYWDKTYLAEQKVAFEIQLDWAKELRLPIAIHCRESLDLVIELVSKHQDGRLKGVFHCFNGNEQHATLIKDLGFIMGIGGVVTFKNAGLDAILPAIGLDNMVLETDSPYLAPVPYRGKRNEPSYLEQICQKIAEIMHSSVDEVNGITTLNAEKLFKHG